MVAKFRVPILPEEIYDGSTTLCAPSILPCKRRRGVTLCAPSRPPRRKIWVIKYTVNKQERMEYDK
jgi:hypothetical protein